MQNSQENTCARVSFDKVVGLKPANFIKKEETVAQVFNCDFRDLKATLLESHLDDYFCFLKKLTQRGKKERL